MLPAQTGAGDRDRQKKLLAGLSLPRRVPILCPARDKLHPFRPLPPERLFRRAQDMYAQPASSNASRDDAGDLLGGLF